MIDDQQRVTALIIARIRMNIINAEIQKKVHENNILSSYKFCKKF